jgi:hypothetical protein
MEWLEDRMVPSASSSTLPAHVAPQEARSAAIATKAAALAAPSEIARASPIVVPTAVSACSLTPPEPAAAAVGKSVAKAKGKAKAKAKRTAEAPTRATPTNMPKPTQVAAMGRGSKEARY